MRDWSRRDFLKTGLVAAAGSPVAPRVLGARSAIVSAARPFPLVAPPRERLLLDSGWRFALGHADDPARDFGYGSGRMFDKQGHLFGPSRANFDVSAWRQVDLPHDWAVELPFENARELIEFGAKPLGRAYPATSIGWYRKVFDIPATDAGRRLSIEFDGVFRDCTVALNGHPMGTNFSGYAPFRFDVTDYVEYGGTNVLVVRVDATGREGWFYEGAGIYRHVWLEKTNAVHVGHWGSFIASEVAGGRASVEVSLEIDNDGDDEIVCDVRTTVGTSATPAARVTLPAHQTTVVRRKLTVDQPSLWSPETPHLYTAATTLSLSGIEVDRFTTRFGIRSLHFDADRGFLLNGKRVELKGTCNHQDHAGVGSALPDRLQFYRIERLKAMGSNAYRTAHNPPASELLDACDQLGMLVLDETRLFSSEPEGVSQLERMIRRDRNHPSIFAWSISNEEWYTQGLDRGARVATTLARRAKALDPSRPVTAAMDGSWGRGISLALDVQGCNYERPQRPESNLDTFHATHPRMPVMGTEVASTYCTRAVYANDTAKGYVSAYDVNRPDYGATAEQWWTRFDERPWLAGGFVWTGFDYRGEPSPYAWPCISSHFGIMDTCGFPKDNFYYYQAWWGSEPVLHLFPHWNWPGREGQPIDVWVHSNLDRVELLLDGRSLGSREIPRNSHASWSVPYAPGVLVARGYRAGRAEPVLETTRATTGPASRIVLSPDRARIDANGEDVSVVTVSVVDEAGLMVPTAEHEIAFAISGAGKLIGVGNGDPSSHESDKGTTRRLFGGLCAAIVQAGRNAGDLRIEAASPGLRSALLTVECARATPRASM